jgi:hypothetical protein
VRRGGHTAEIRAGARPRPPAREVAGVKFVMICIGGTTSREGATRDLAVTYMAWTSDISEASCAPLGSRPECHKITSRENIFLWAYGLSDVLGYHTDRISFDLNLRMGEWTSFVWRSAPGVWILADV